MHSLSYNKNEKTKWLKLLFLVCIVFLSLAVSGYPMQPPPPPLNLNGLKKNISEADLIVAGRIDAVRESESTNGKETEITLDVTLIVEEVLKGEVSGKTVAIKEVYTSPYSSNSGLVSKDNGAPKKAIIGMRAGPVSYHGRYTKGDRIIVLLTSIAGTAEYRPLGSGTYDKYLFEFYIEDNGIKALYFGFAPDLLKYVGSEEEFKGLIKSFIDSHSEKQDK